MRWIRDNSLTLVLMTMFLAFTAAQLVTGMHEYNGSQIEHGGSVVGMREYLGTGHPWEALFENWESEFLQMAAFVLLTTVLFQKGSSESKKPGGGEAVDRDPRAARGEKLAKAPWPVRRGGWVLRLYEHSLSIAFLLLFVVSFAAHAVGGAIDYSDEQVAHGGAPVGVLGYLATSRFWFESFQNWQSEFLALVGMVVLSIFLRQRGSPESKPVDAPHSLTGSE